MASSANITFAAMRQNILAQLAKKLNSSASVQSAVQGQIQMGAPIIPSYESPSRIQIASASEIGDINIASGIGSWLISPSGGLFKVVLPTVAVIGLIVYMKYK